MCWLLNSSTAKNVPADAVGCGTFNCAHVTDFRGSISISHTLLTGMLWMMRNKPRIIQAQAGSLTRHSNMQALFRAYQVIMVISSLVQLNPVNGSIELTGSCGIVERDRRTGFVSDIAGLIP